MFLMWIIPLTLILLLVYTLAGNKPLAILQPAGNRICPSCNQPVQNDWKNCPHCGQALQVS